MRCHAKRALGLAVLSALGLLWTPLLLALPLLVLAIGAVLGLAVVSTSHTSFPTKPQSCVDQLKAHSPTAFLHLLQPLARLWGRLRHGLTPWRRGTPHFAFPRPRTSTIWSERWQAPEARLASLEAALREQDAVVMRGGDFDRWDLEVRDGLFGVVRTLMAIEEHGGGKQLVRFRSWPRCSPPGLVLALLFALLTTGAAISQAWPAPAILGLAAMLLTLRTFGDCAAATASFLHALGTAEGGVRPDAYPTAPDRREGALAPLNLGRLERGHGE